MTKILCFSWGLQALAILAVLMGIRGTISLDKLNENAQKYKNCIGTREAPVFVNNNYLSLPWMTKNSVSKREIISAWNRGPHSDSLNIKKGEEIGYFTMGSTVILLIPETIQLNNNFLY